MILQELFETSTFRKRSTSEMTFGFEFEVMNNANNEDYNVIAERLMEKYPFDNYVNENIKYYDFRNKEPIYGFASKDDIAQYNSEKNPQEAKLVKEIMNLKDDNYKKYYIDLLYNTQLSYKNEIKINNISDFDEYLNKNYSSEILNDIFKDTSNIKNEKFDKFINRIFNTKFLYIGYLINDRKVFDYIYDKNKNVLYLKTDIKISQLEELFEDSEDIINEFEENYNQKITEMVYDKLNNKNLLENVKKLLKKSNIENVDVKLDISLGYNGVEIVTEKIYGIDKAISQFNKITKFIQNEDTFYTDENTGLHVNIGTWNDISQLDLTKLLVFSNETQILKNMERQNNRYTKSLIDRLVSYLKRQNNYKNLNKIIKDMNEELLASARHTYFMDFKKLKNSGYIEIRGFGNKDYEYKSDYIIKMIRYLSRIMEIASDSEEAKQQYIKKLYKVFNLETKLSGEKQENISNNSVLSNDEISTILRFFPVNVKNYYEKKLKNSEEITIILLRLLDYDKKLTNGDLRILYKLLKSINISKNYYENIIKGKSEKIDNLFQNYLLT